MQRYVSAECPLYLCLYKDGWYIGYDTIEAARSSTEKYVKKSGIEFEIRGNVKAWVVKRTSEERSNEPNWEWRGLAKQPKGLKIVASDK